MRRTLNIRKARIEKSDGLWRLYSFLKVLPRDNVCVRGILLYSHPSWEEVRRMAGIWLILQRDKM